MRVLITDHSYRRLKNFRQLGIEVDDIIEASNKIPGQVPTATRFRGFMARSGKEFDLVVKDNDSGRLIITVIGRCQPLARASENSDGVLGHGRLKKRR